uniref:Transducin family protein n=1 Tax=Tetraselmis sp. GSL018 TaxID=582737 RepID=A0A061QP84_9CHLO
MHIRFEEDDVDSEAMETYADEPLRASQLTFSAQPNETPATLSVATSARVDFGSEDECYVYNVVNRFVGGSLAVAASLSNRRIKLYAGRETTLSPVGDLIGHQGNIQDIAFALPEAASTLHSCALDGTVRGWEIRTKQEVERLQASGRQLFSVSAFDNIVAAGSNSEVLFWDRRTGKLLQSFQDAHAEEVTQVKFHPEQPNTFLTASTDGLINVYNTSSGLNEDDGFQACLNTGNSAAEVGFYGPRGSTSGTGPPPAPRRARRAAGRCCPWRTSGRPPARPPLRQASRSSRGRSTT